MSSGVRYQTGGGIEVERCAAIVTYDNAIEPLTGFIDQQLGVVLASCFDYPGRYTRWDIGFCNPMLVFEATGRSFVIRALNLRGQVVLPTIIDWLRHSDENTTITANDVNTCYGQVRESTQWFPEELRSRQPTVFSVLRTLLHGFYSDNDHYLGFYGAFGYELAFQFEPLRLELPRDASTRDLVLFLPDDLLIVDHQQQNATHFRYEFRCGDQSTVGLARTGESFKYRPAQDCEQRCDHTPEEYADTVRTAIECFRRGDLFEVVPGQKFSVPCVANPSLIFERLRERNPAPYAALMNLGRGEYLVAASPEMYVRVKGRRIETCPISGTIRRGRNAIADAAQIRALLNSTKDESELTMCTDVDRNDKSRVCEAGSVRVIGRRQIEMYSRLIHTADHVEGLLSEGFDALDGFLAHTWAVTVTGAPKHHAMQFIEDHEKSPRRWYGGAIGSIGFDGNLNTGLTLRTVHIVDGVAEVRAGATLLFDSDPEAEEAETRLKASALFDAILHDQSTTESQATTTDSDHVGIGKHILMVDHEDSFVHTLASYFRYTGAEVTIWRDGFPLPWLAQHQPQLLLLSPGPGRPQDFNINATIQAAIENNIPIFGVCMGLQGIVEYFGGTLDLSLPMHGKSSAIHVCSGRILDGLPASFSAGRYHSLIANRATLPDCLGITAETDDGTIMAIEHRSLPIAAVQFHPESILSQDEDQGMTIIRNVVASLASN